MKYIYIEKQLNNHPIVKEIIKKFPNNHQIIINKYSEVFNPTNQNFKLQKSNPAIILAKKQNNFIHPTPENFGITNCDNYYFSHMLNCPYDCRYCFLQGMFNSANYVIFVNYEDFQEEILKIDQSNNKIKYFFSGYDADSLAFDQITKFSINFIPFFNKLNNSYLELRTKSAQISNLLKFPPSDRIILASSFTPKAISNKIEYKVADFDQRLINLVKIAQYGYKIGIRLDPLIYCENFEDLYNDLIDHIFNLIPQSQIHSVSIGKLRFPIKMYDKIHKLYPKEPLLHYKLVKDNKYVSYNKEIEKFMFDIVEKQLTKFIDKSFIFKCYS